MSESTLPRLNRIGGIYKDGHCFAPPAEAVSGSRQFPGHAHIPSDIATAPAVSDSNALGS